MVKNKLGLIEISGQKIGVVADDECIGKEDSSSSSEDEDGGSNDGSSNSDSIDLTCREPPLGAQESSPETPRAPPTKPGVATCPVFTFFYQIRKMCFTNNRLTSLLIFGPMNMTVILHCLKKSDPHSI